MIHWYLPLADFAGLWDSPTSETLVAPPLRGPAAESS